MICTCSFCLFDLMFSKKCNSNSTLRYCEIHQEVKDIRKKRAMFKLQVLLVPPSIQNGPVSFGFTSSTADSSQLIGTGSVMGAALANNGDATLPYPSSLSAANTTLFPTHFAQRKRKKFLHFTRSTNTLLDLSVEIIQKCEKMYPTLNEDIEILSLQDNSGCDLDPDFLIKDVFNVDNTVRVILKNELDIDDSSPVSVYRTNKRKRLNNGLSQPQISSAQSAPPASAGSNGILKIAKKRSSASVMRNPTSGNMRISTPLAHQIYPPPSVNSRMASNNSEDEDAGERSFLPPPAQPQSPPIRISSGIDNSKKVRSVIEDDAVSRSETVDPDKSKQQRLLSGTPIRTTMTPNRVTLTGQRVVSERTSTRSNDKVSIFATGPLPKSRQRSTANTRITSGMLSIPEPRIAEIEKELKEGPASPASLLPAVPDRIPMKKPYQKMTTYPSDDDLSDSEEQETDAHVKASIQRQTSIADNNGSPVKTSPLGDNASHNVYLAELPKTTTYSTQGQRKTSLETKVETKTLGPFTHNSNEEEPKRIVNFSEEEEREEEHENDEEMENQIDFIEGKSSEEKESEEEENDTVVILRDGSDYKSSNTSIQKIEFLRLMEGDPSGLPPWYRGTHDGHKKKPYTTVLHKDIDNSKPDPRNIMPKRTPRSAAKKAAQLLSGKQSQSSTTEDESDMDASSIDDSSSGIETGGSVEDEDDRISVNENNSIKTLNIHPLKEKVISSDDSQPSMPEPNIAATKLNVADSEPLRLKISIEGSKEQTRGPPVIQEGEVEGIDMPNKSTVNNESKMDSKDEHGITNKSSVPFQKENLQPHDGPERTAKTTSEGQIAFPGGQLPSQKASNPVFDNIKKPSAAPIREEVNASVDASRALSMRKKEEAEAKRRDREAAKVAKLEAAKRIKAEKEAKKHAEREAKRKAAEEARKAREEEAARKKLDRENKKILKQAERKKQQQINTKQIEGSTGENKISHLEKPDTKSLGKGSNKALSDGSDKLKELKAQFTKSRTYVPAGLVPQNISRSNDNSSKNEISASSEEESSSDYSSSSSDEESASNSRKSRRLIVDTPKGSVTSATNKLKTVGLAGVEEAPQSTQRSSVSNQATPNKVPVTRIMELSSPVQSKTEPPKRASFLQGLPQKVRPSLSSLSDLVSRGVPEVKEKSIKASGNITNQVTASKNEQDDDDSISESGSEESESDSSSSDNDSSFISAKLASRALRKKKKNDGFASLIKDSKRAD